MTTIINKQKKKQSYFREVQGELKKVTWTTKEDLKSSTKVVLLSTFVFGLGIYLADLAIRGALNVIGYLFRTVGG